MFCPHCGEQIYPNETVCRRCGTSVDQSNQPMQQNPTYAGYSQTIYVQTDTSYHPEEHVSTGGWIGRNFLMMIPIVNIILLFVWAFSSTKQRSLQTWARAQLIMILISIVVTILIVVLMAVLGANIFNSMSRSGGYYYY